MTGGSGHMGRGGDACEGVMTWVDGQVGGVVVGSMVVGSMVMWQHGRGATSLWGSVVVVVSKGGTCHQCDACDQCDVSLPAPLLAAAAGMAARRGWQQ